MQTIPVLLADDSEVVRRSICSFLRAEDGIALVGEVDNFGVMVDTVARLKPQVVVLDLHLPARSNVSPQRVKSLLSGSKVLAISFSCDQEAQHLAQSFGAVALLDKCELYGALIPAILRVAEAAPLPAVEARDALLGAVPGLPTPA